MKLLFKFSRNLTVLLCLAVLLATACNKQSPTGVNDLHATVVINIVVADGNGSSPQNQSLGKITKIVKVVVTVSGPGIEPSITKELQIVGKTATGSVKVPQGNSRTFTVAGVDENGVTQLEGARTINITGPSATVDITVTKILPNPSSLRVVGEPQHNLVRLAWDKNSDVDFKRYELYRSTTTSRPSQPLVSIEDKNMTSYADSTVEELRTYTYWLNTVDTEGYPVQENALPQVAANTPRSPVPPPVTVTKQSESKTAVKISWTRSEAVTFAFYRVARSEVSPVTFNAPDRFDITDRNTTTFIDNTVKECKDYFYAVYVVGRASYGDFPSQISNEVKASTKFRITEFLLYDGGTAQAFVNAHSFGPGGGTGDFLFVQFTCSQYPSRIDSIQVTFQTDGTPGAFCIEIIPSKGTDPILYRGPALNEPVGARRKNFPVNWGPGEGEATADFFAGIRYLGDGKQPGLHVDTTRQDSSRSYYFRESDGKVYYFPDGDLHFHIRAHVSRDGCAGGQWIAAQPVPFAQPQSLLTSRRSMPIQTTISRQNSNAPYLRPLKILRFNRLRQ